METIPSLGKLVESRTLPERDAVHIAVVPVEAGMDLAPGQHVRITHIGDVPKAWETSETADGVVDPYLREPIRDGEIFWLFLKPGTIQSLRHAWTHPAFPSKGAVSDGDRATSEAWLRQYAERYEANYEDMIQGAITGKGYCFGDDDGPPQYRGAENEFWSHVERVVGRHFDTDHRENTNFRCAC